MAFGKKAAKLPTNDDEFHAAIKEVGHLRGQLATLEASMNNELVPIKERFEKGAQPINNQLAVLEAAVEGYAGKHRKKLTEDGKKKTVKLPTGKISWKARAASVKLVGDVADIIARIKGLRSVKAKALLRTKVEIDKSAVIKGREFAETIEGIEIIEGEETFKIEPFGSELA